MDGWAETGFHLKSKEKREEYERRWFTFIYLRSYGWLVKGSWNIPGKQILPLISFVWLILWSNLLWLLFNLFRVTFCFFHKITFISSTWNRYLSVFCCFVLFFKQRLEIVKGKFLSKVRFSQSSRGFCI